MPQLLDIGPNAWEAARGDYSPGTILTTRGDTLSRDASGPVRLALGTSGQFLKSNGTDLVYGNPPGKRLLTHAAYGAVTNPTSAASLLGGASTNLWPAFVTAGDAVRVSFGGHANGATSTTFTLTMLMGATTVATFATATNLVNTRNFYGDIWCKFDTSTSVRPYGQCLVRGSTSTGFQSAPTLGDLLIGDGTAVTVSAGPQDFDLKAIIGTSNASSTVTLESLDVWHYPV